MKDQTGHRPSADKTSPTTRPARRRSVTNILREAYRRFTGDPATRRAVRRCLS